MYWGLTRLGFKIDIDFVLQDDSDGRGAYIRDWTSDKPQPSAEEIQIAEDAHIAEYNSNKYQRDRKPLYGTWEDQADMQYWDAVNGTTLWQEHIAEIKAKHPKE